MKFIIPIFLLIPIQLFSQIDSTITTENIIIDLFEESSIDIDENYLYDLLEDLRDNPVNINEAGINELIKIPFVDLNSAKAIVQHRIKYGNYFSTQELYSVENLSYNIARALQLFTTYREETEEQIVTTKINSFELRSRVITDLQEKKGFRDMRYLGGSIKSYQRVKLSAGKVYLSGLIEKDPGEKSINDFTSYSLSLNDYKFISNITAGDYLVEFGQGLVLYGPYSFGKGSQAVGSVSRSARNIKGYTSTDENQFFRGIAASFSFSPLNFSLYYSNHNIDASIDSISNEIVSFPVTGYHRTNSELSREDNVNETSFGFILNFSPLSSSVIGFSFQRYIYQRGIKKNDIFDPSGKNFNLYSISYSFVFDKFRLSGEAAYNSISVATINNIEWLITDKLQFLTSVRNYPRNFYSFRGSGFGETSNTKNEFGIYNGIRWRSEFGIFNFYYDQFNFPYQSFNSPLPSKGHEILIDFAARPFPKSELNIKFKMENKEVSERRDDLLIITDQQKINYRISYEFHPVDQLRLKTRIEYVTFQQKYFEHSEEGFLLFQDFRYDPSNLFRFYGRVVLFQTESFDSRVYEFENDVRGVLLNPALYNDGMRWYLIAEYRPAKFLRLSAKYSETIKPGELSLGSGLNQISGSLDNRFTLQFDLDF